MAGITNTATTRYLTALDVEQFKSNKIFDEITTGRKSDISVVDKILGFRTYYAANTAREVIKQIGTGVNVTNVANSTLSEVQNQIEELKLSIIALSNADGIALTAGQTNYVNQLDRINKTLGNVIFGTKKLFDGTSSLTGSPFNVQVGTNATDVVRIIIEKLTNGLGLNADVITTGTNNPLFPVTAKAIANKDFAVQQIEEINNTAYADNASDSNTNIQALAPLLAGNPVQVAINNAAKDASAAALAAGATNDFLGANKIYNAAINAGLDVAKQYGYISEAALTAIHSVIATGDEGMTLASTDTDYYNKIAGMPTPDAAVDYMGNFIIATAKATLDAASGVAGSFLQQKHLVLFDILHNSALINTSPYGTLATDADRTNAITLLTAASDKLTAIIANISGQQASLVQAKSINSTLFVQLSDAYATYLNANYEVAISALTESDRKITVASLANFLAEKLINSIIDQLAQAARAA